MAAPSWGNILPVDYENAKTHVQSTFEEQAFSRILNGKFYDTEEARYDKPPSFANGFSYIGLAQAGSATYDPVWSLVRISYDSLGRRNREQFMANRSWDNRSIGWS